MLYALLFFILQGQPLGFDPASQQAEQIVESIQEPSEFEFESAVPS